MISNAIIKRIFDYFGVRAATNLPRYTPIFTILSDNLLLDKKLSIELEDGEHLHKNIWAGVGKISNSVVKVLVADITTDLNIGEYVLLLQMDELSIYALKIELVENAANKAYINYSSTDGIGESWVELSNLLLAKLLVGIEQLDELMVNYQPLTNYQELYKHLISFTNYEETTHNK